MKLKNNQDKKNKEGNKSKVGQIRMISESGQNQRASKVNNKGDPKKRGSKVSVNSKAPKVSTTKINIDSVSLLNANNQSIDINFKEIPSDISKEIPKSLLCNICKNLVKKPSKCYMCNALFCMDCLFAVLDKYKKCPKCYKIISKNIIQKSCLEKEFKNTFIKCKYKGCKESINLFDYEEHLRKCPFKKIKDEYDIDNLAFFDNLPLNKDPYSNSVLMDYCMQRAENDKLLNNETSYINDDEKMEQQLKNINELRGEKETNNIPENLPEIFKDIIKEGKKFEYDIDELDKRQNEVNGIVKQLQNKIILHEIV